MLELLNTLRLADVLDIVVLAVLTFLLLRWLLHRATWSAAAGLGVLALLFAAAHWLDMFMTLTVFRIGSGLIAIALVVVFQEEIRRGFQRLAAWRPFSHDMPSVMDEVNEVLVEAAQKLAEQHVGALIVLKGNEPIEGHIRGGIVLDGRPSLPLLLSLFDHRTPGHDGAAIIVGPRISKYGAHLPLSTNLAEVRGAGTRHTAALGLAERTDSMVIVVSEERGAISVAHNGTLRRLDSAAQLSTRVGEFNEHRRTTLLHIGWQSALARLAGACASAIVACALWWNFAYDVEQVQYVFDNVPVEYRKAPDNWVVERVEPERVRLTLTGPERAFAAMMNRPLLVSIDLSTLREGIQSFTVNRQMLDLPNDIEIREGQAPTIELSAYRIVEVTLQVRPNMSGESPIGLRVEPKSVRVILPVDRQELTTHIWTTPINIATLKQRGAVTVNLVMPNKRTQVAKGQRAQVKVSLEKPPPQEKPK